LTVEEDAEAAEAMVQAEPPETPTPPPGRPHLTRIK
jgi:hypothetical protein